MRISGNEYAQKIINGLKEFPTPKKEFAAILVGDDSISLNFLKEKEKIAKELGVKFELYRISDELSEGEIKERVAEIAEKESVGGVIVQLPLPQGIDRHEVLNMIPKDKDVDVLGELAIGAFYNGHNYILPPSVAVVEDLLKFCKVDIEKSNVAVVGMGLLIGKPIATWFMNKCKNLCLIGKESDINRLKNADIVVSGTGEPGLIKPDMLKRGSIVIDFGYAFIDGKMVGDLDTKELTSAVSPGAKELSFYTPTPGGTGPILVAKLFENFYKLNGDNK